MRDSGVVIGEIGTPQAYVVCFSHVFVQRFEIALLVVEMKHSEGSEIVDWTFSAKCVIAFGSGKYIR